MSAPVDELNPAQRAAVEHGAGPLLIVAGAGSGKTATLAHRVARLLSSGADPRRILLLTFSRRAAVEMTRRVERVVAAPNARVHWAGTFHAIANRLLRVHAIEAGLDPGFTVLDRADAADLLDVVRHERGLSQSKRRFPKKGTCLAIYSRAVNSQAPLERCLDESFPWCSEWADELRGLFAAYVERKQRAHVLDYDDLLLYWLELMREEALAGRVRALFDHVFVDEYQDTNLVQSEILYALAPDGRGVTVVGDDAQAIYSFRAATVRNILDFPEKFRPPATLITLEQNYRSTVPILDAANAVIAEAKEGYAKTLFSTRRSQQRPLLVTAEDERAQVDYVVAEVLRAREAGVPLRQQAVLFRSAHHSDALEVELGRRNIPFVKYGGLKFLEAAHVKDALSILRLAENLRDEVAAFRVLQLLPGVGPSTAQRAFAALAAREFSLDAVETFAPPPSAREDWPGFCALLLRLARDAEWPAQLGMARKWYEPHLARIYDHATLRTQDLAELEQIAAHYPSRERFLSELTLDPPQATGDHAGAPLLDEDYLILSTIHSAKGQEWDTVFVLNASDGCIPSDLAARHVAQIEEERRLFYVAMTRAKNALHIIHPLRFYVHQQAPYGDRHVYAPRTRFLPDALLDRFELVGAATALEGESATNLCALPALDLGRRLRNMWS
jgi:DNA helicase-2/ATP-dependent DNA helicase PcrA